MLGSLLSLPLAQMFIFVRLLLLLSFGGKLYGCKHATAQDRNGLSLPNEYIGKRIILEHIHLGLFTCLSIFMKKFDINLKFSLFTCNSTNGLLCSNHLSIIFSGTSRCFPFNIQGVPFATAFCIGSPANQFIYLIRS